MNTSLCDSKLTFRTNKKAGFEPFEITSTIFMYQAETDQFSWDEIAIWTSVIVGYNPTGNDI